MGRYLEKGWSKSFPKDILRRARRVVAIAHTEEGLAPYYEYSFEIHDVAVYLWRLLRPKAFAKRTRVSGPTPRRPVRIGTVNDLEDGDG